MDTNSSSAETPQSTQLLSWKPLVLTDEKINELWEKVQKFPQAFDDFSTGDKAQFVRNLLDPRNIFVDIGDGLGLACGFNVRPKLDMVLHLLMFDRRLKGREPVLLDMMSYYFKHLQLRRMTAMITADQPMTAKLLGRLGFTLEGTVRGGILRGGEYLDVLIYGMLREELRRPDEISTNGPSASREVSRESADARC